MNRDELDKIVEEAAIEKEGAKRMPCALAFELAAAHGVAPREIGDICNRRGIKIVRCQLGCF